MSDRQFYIDDETGRGHYASEPDDVSASFSNELLSVDIGLLKEVNDLCQLIVGSPPDTTIKGKIESLAFSIGHHPNIIGR